MESSFLARLPAELREEIYELVLCRHQPHSILLSSRPPTIPAQRAASTPLSLAQTCRQIRIESLPIFFGGNRFEFRTDRISTHERPYGAGALWLPSLENWLYTIGDTNRRRLRTVDIEIRFWTVHPLDSRDGQFAYVVWSCLLPVLEMLPPSTEVWLSCRLLWNDGCGGTARICASRCEMLRRRSVQLRLISSISRDTRAGMWMIDRKTMKLHAWSL